MFNISKLADYASVIMSFLASKKEAYYSATEVSEELQIAAPTVSKLLKLLNDANLLTSTRGAYGGYQLAKSPDKINLVEMINAVDGQVALTQCCESNSLCDRERHCQLRGQWQWVNDEVTQLLSGITLSDLQKKRA